MNLEPQRTTDAPLSELLKRLQTDLVELADTEMKLVKAELSLKWEEAKTQGALLMVTLSLAILAGISLTACAILALSTTMPPWLAALIVGGVQLAGCGVAFSKWKAAMKSFTPKPRHTMENIQRDVDRIGEATR